jgi:AcrR family transcriptional regulator
MYDTLSYIVRTIEGRSRMSVPASAGGTRPRLDRERVLRGAVDVADRGGIGALTIRSLADELGVKPMTVYHYVKNKDEILDGIVDVVFGEIELPTVGGDWRTELRRRARSAREVLRVHSWAIPLLESRTSPGPATLRHHDAVLGVLRAGGFSAARTAHAYALLDAFLYGHAVQEASLPFEGPEGPTEVAPQVVESMSVAGDFPHLAEMMASYYLRPGYDFADEFEIGLDAVLDSLSRWRSAPEDRNPDDPERR